MMVSEAENRFLTSRSADVWLCCLHHKIKYKQKSNMKKETKIISFFNLEVLKKQYTQLF